MDIHWSRLGSRSVGFTSATFFSQSKMFQSSLNWGILNAVQGQQCHIVLPKIVQNCSTWPKLAQQKRSKLLEMTQAGPKKTAQSCSKFLKIAQNCSKFLKVARNFSKCLTIGQQVSKGVMCLHIQVRKLSLLGIAVAGVYCCMGLRSVSIEPRLCLLLRSEPSIVSFNWQGSLVIRLVAIVSINGLSRENCIALIEKQFMPAVSFASLLPLGDSTIRHELLFLFLLFWILEMWKVADLNPMDLHPKLRTVRYAPFSEPMLNPYKNLWGCGSEDTPSHEWPRVPPWETLQRGNVSPQWLKARRGSRWKRVTFDSRDGHFKKRIGEIMVFIGKMVCF